MDRESLNYVKIIWKRLWLVILCGALVGGVSYWFRNQQAPAFQSQVRVFITNAFATAPDVGQLDTSERLAILYAEFLQNYSLLADTIEHLEIPTTPEELQQAINTYVIPDTPILVINVTYPNAQRAADIANDLANRLIDNIPSSLTPSEQQRLESLEAQIEGLENQIAVLSIQTADALEALNQAIDGDADADTVESLREEYNQFTARLGEYQGTLSDVTTTFLNLSSKATSLQVIEPARIPTRSSGISAVLVGVVGVVFGLIAGVGIVLLFEFINPTMRYIDELGELDLPILGTVPNISGVRRPEQYLVDRRSIVPRLKDEISTIYINTFLGKKANQKIYMIVSSSVREGRTLITANLAVHCANQQLRVLLIDSSLDNATLQQVFKLKNDKGFIDLADAKPVNLKDYVQSTAVPGLDVITMGMALSDNMNAVDTNSIKQALNSLINKEKYDLVLIDTAALEKQVDVYLMGHTLEANIVFLASLRRTRRAAIEEAWGQFQRLPNATPVGLIVNRA